MDTTVTEVATELIDPQQTAAVATADITKAQDLIEAVREGQVEEVKLLLDAGADVNATMNATSGDWWYNQAPAITHAVLTNHSEVLRLLIDYGADLNQGERGYHDTALHTAAHLNEVDMINILLESGADPNPISSHKGWETPLHYAAEAGALEAIQALVDGGIDADTRIDHGLTPLMNTARKGAADTAPKVAAVLLENGADPNLLDEKGNSALHYEAMKGRAGVALLLIENGADLDLQNNSGDTALHSAARGNKVDVASILIEHGAVLNLRNSEGETALDVAKEDEMVELLTEAAEQED